MTMTMTSTRRKEALGGAAACCENDVDMSDAVGRRLDLNCNHRDDVREIEYHDLEIQGRLGTGSFSVVLEVTTTSIATVAVLEDEETPCCSSSSAETYVSSSVGSVGSQTGNWRQQHNNNNNNSSRSSDRSSSSTSHHPYAMKRLRADVLASSEEARFVAIQDFMLEAELLARLPLHPNIIRMTAVSDGFFENPGQGFLLLERLDETLEQLLATWQLYGRNPYPAKAKAKAATTTPKPKPHMNPITKLFSQSRGNSNRPNPEEQQADRVASYAVGIAHAMQHLHSHNIVFRDLKPSNIGRNSARSNVLCLFDFGLARSVPHDRLMTAAAGTVRFMAPEVALGKLYGYPADVYSFGMLLWQITLLQRPFGKIHCKEQFIRTTVQLEQRPSLKGIRSTTIQHLIHTCWNPNPKMRPAFSEVVLQLNAALATTTTASLCCEPKKL